MRRPDGFNISDLLPYDFDDAHDEDSLIVDAIMRGRSVAGTIFPDYQHAVRNERVGLVHVGRKWGRQTTLGNETYHRRQAERRAHG